MNPKATPYKLFIMLGVALFIAASLFGPWTTVDKKQTSLITTAVGDAVSQQSKPKEDRETRARTQNGTSPNQQPAKRRRPTLLPQLELLPLTTTDTAALSELILPTVSSAEGLSAVEEMESVVFLLGSFAGRRGQQELEALKFRPVKFADS